MRLKWMSNIAMHHSGRENGIEGDQPYPPIDMVVTGEEVHIWVDLPGVKDEDINLYIQDDLLIIEGVKQSYCPQGRRRIFHRVERQSSPFRRILKLQSPVAKNSIFSKLDNGVLHIIWKRN